MDNLKSTSHWYLYPLTHWRGQQGLMWSFWVNLIGLRLVILFAQSQFSPAPVHDYSDYVPFVLSVNAFFHVIVLLWQIVGVLRAGEKFIREGGTIVRVWGTYLGILIAFWMSLSFGFDAWQWTLPYPGKKLASTNLPQYSITLKNAGKTVLFSGEIEPGTTNKFRQFLAANKDVTVVELKSRGGNIYEARGVAKLIREAGLSTHVDQKCSSACTTIFIAGKVRTMGHGGLLGFHKYRIAVNYQVGFADTDREQKIDKILFLSAGVKKAFVEKMFAYEASEMWFPDVERLRGAGVITTAKHNGLLPNFFQAAINGDAFYQRINSTANL